MDREPAERRDARPGAASGSPGRGRQAQREAHPVEPGRGDVLGADVGIGREAVGHRRGPASGSAIRRTRAVVGVEDGDAVGRQGLDELRLRVLDRVDRADPAQVDAEDRRHDPDPGPGDPGELGDLAADVHPHLEHGGLVLRAKPQERQRQADLVVLVALAPERPAIASPRTVAMASLVDVLAMLPGDADDERVEPGPPAGGDGLEGARARPARGGR